MTFVVWLLSGAILLTSGAVVTLTTPKPLNTLEECQAAAMQAQIFIAHNDQILAASMECRPHELPIPPPNTEKLAPEQEG